MQQHPRAFSITVVWTLGLLYLGSVVHATESSLACPDWPTCFGTLVPEMSGGVFWEHLHRLVAAGLVLIFAAAVYLSWRPEADRKWVRMTGLAGVGLLIVQSVFGGLTVLFLLPDAVSTTHLGLAFLFLGLATVLAVSTSSGWRTGDRGSAGPVRTLAVSAAFLTFVQSVLGALVRHTDSGLVCPDVPTCLGRWIPPLVSPQVAIHFFHRLTAVLLVAVILWLTVVVIRREGPGLLRTLAWTASAAVAAQFALGVLSVTTRLAVAPVSLHTLFGALTLTLLVWMATLTWKPGAVAGPVADLQVERSAAHGS
jgi:heme A synthase